MTGKEALLTVAEAYRVAEGTTRSIVSWRVFEDTRKLQALVDGKDIQLSRFERAMLWFSENWPANVGWPIEIARPAPAAPADPAQPAPEPAGAPA